jgi:hypothetical protein
MENFGNISIKKPKWSSLAISIIAQTINNVFN